jgi:hypothetical protein
MLQQEKLAKQLGFSAAIITTVVIVIGIHYVYKSYLDTTLTNLQIKKIKRELNQSI